jgi:putative 4-mercaptohistidine N1-methyltranferase
MLMSLSVRHCAPSSLETICAPGGAPQQPPPPVLRHPLPYPPPPPPPPPPPSSRSTADICALWCGKLGVPLDSALDVGCAVGRSCYEFSRPFSRVVGIDFSHAFIAAANALKASGEANYTLTVEGTITASHVARVPAGVNASRITFQQGDACALPPAAELGGRFSVIHAANLLCRLPDPNKFLERLPSLLVPGGLAVFISPYSWLPQYTEPSKWLGGTVDAASGGKPRWSTDGITARMTAMGFSLVHTEDCPFLIREHARKFQWGCSQVMVWQLKKA